MNDFTTAPRLLNVALKTSFSTTSVVSSDALSGLAGAAGATVAGAVEPAAGDAVVGGVAAAAAGVGTGGGRFGGLGAGHSQARSTPRERAAATRRRFSMASYQGTGSKPPLWNG